MVDQAQAATLSRSRFPESWTIENGRASSPLVIPDGFKCVATATCPSSITPYDSYARRFAEMEAEGAVETGIEVRYVKQAHAIVAPMGSGPGGRVRCGDDMLPPTIHICVPEGQVNAALAAMAASKARRERELNEQCGITG